VFQCSLHCISAHCYTTHAHREGHLILRCKCYGTLHLPPSLSKNDGTVVKTYVTILHFGIILLTTKIVIVVIYSSQRLHIYMCVCGCVCVSKIHSICQSYSTYHNNNDSRCVNINVFHIRNKNLLIQMLHAWLSVSVSFFLHLFPHEKSTWNMMRKWVP